MLMVRGQPMSRLCYSLGRATRFAARSIGGVRGPEKSAGRTLRERIQADLVMALLALAAGRLRGAALVLRSGLLRRVASGALRRRTILIFSGMQVSFRALARMLSGRRSPSPSIKAVEEQAEGIARVLRERDIVPDRLGIDGVPGSGKSSLASALAERLDMEWESLDYQDLGLRGILGRKRTIYEHYRLFRTQDVDAFDAIVYIDEPVELSRAKVRGRGRGLVLAAILDYDRLKKIGELAFDVCDGEPVSVPGGHVVLKIRPPEGFGALENIAGRLGAAGSDTSGMSKEAMLFLLACGRPQEGLTAYLLPLAYVARIGRLAAALHSAGRTFVTVFRADDSAGDLAGQTNADSLAAT